MPPKSTRPSRAIAKRRLGRGAWPCVKNALKWLVYPKTLLLHSQFTRQIAAHYCTGRGCEIGPGLNPQAPPERTYFIDRYARYGDTPIAVDVVADAVALPFAAGSQDFLVSSHVLEHCPGTLAVLEEWKRVLRPGGTLLLRLPHRDRCFDKPTPADHAGPPPRRPGSG